MSDLGVIENAAVLVSDDTITWAGRMEDLSMSSVKEEEVITIVATFLGAHAVPPEFKGKKDDYVREITDRMIPYIGAKKLAAFCDVFAEKGYFETGESRNILNVGMRYGITPKVHAE